MKKSSPGGAVVVEKASIDEAYVQLPAGCVLATAAPAAARAIRDLVKRRLHLVMSVGAAHNKLLAKLASVASKPDGILVVATETEVERLLAHTPAVKLPGCGGAVASKLQTALGARVISDLADVPKTRLTTALGLTPVAAAKVSAAARGECDAPVVPTRPGGGAKTVGVHMTLTATPRAMPSAAIAANRTSAAGGRAGVFDPLRAGEWDRLEGLLQDMATDLAGRVADHAAAEKRWPRTLTATLALRGGRRRMGRGPGGVGGKMSPDKFQR